MPDESARRVVFDYVNPRRAEWLANQPPPDFIVGNPPFIGASRMREALGDGYAETLRKAWKGDVPESADFVMFWWRKAAELVRDGKVKRFGFITTNSIHQTFNRRVLEPFLADEKNPLHLAFAIPDHPWIDSADGAAVRIAMTVAAPGKGEGILAKVDSERPLADGENEVTLSRSAGVLAGNLQIGADVSSCVELEANDNLSNNGVILGGKDFEVSEVKAIELGLMSRELGPKHIRRYMGGHSLTSRFEESYALDLFGLSEQAVQSDLPEIYQWVYTHIRPKRLQNKRKTRRDRWWLFNESVPKLRWMLAGLPRFIGTTETAKHRMFSFIAGPVLPDHMVISIALTDSLFLGVLSSCVHVHWALKTGGTLEDRPRYNKSRCFETFPFPALEDGELKSRLRALGERLDAHRKRQQEIHPDLTLTGMYNVLEALRAGRTLNAKEKAIHDAGLVSILRQLHDDIDRAVLEAYGWADLVGRGGPAAPTCPAEAGSHGGPGRAALPIADRLAAGGPDAEALEQELLTRLVALNHERAAEEKRGLIRWLRPDFQAPAAATPHLVGLGGPAAPTCPAEAESHGGPGRSALPFLDWPETMAEQVVAVRKLVPTVGPAPEALAACFGRKSKKRVDQIASILDTLKALGHLP